jgi:uncharacterized protein (DUF433 family)
LVQWKHLEPEEPRPIDATIIDRGRGPEIAGTRITVYDILDYVLNGWHPTGIAAFLRLSTHQVLAAMRYIDTHQEEVMAEYREMLARDARGNPPDLQAKLDAAHASFLEAVRQRRQPTSQGDGDARGPAGR